MKRAKGQEMSEAKNDVQREARALSGLLCVYSVLFTECIYESAYATMSLHRTKEGAIGAMKKLKSDVFYGWQMSEFVGFRYGKEMVND